jgi:hypothetical protein
MAKRLKITASKNSESYFIIDDHTDPVTKKRSTFVVERLGNLARWKEELQTDSRDEVVAYLKEKVLEMRKADKEKKEDVSIQLSPAQKIEKYTRFSYNVGYLYLQNIVYALGIKDLCEEISERYSLEFDLSNILSDLICTKILYPDSKRTSLEDASSFYETGQYDLDEVYEAIPVLAKERYSIESALYKKSKALLAYDTSVLFYDCTNFFMEIEDEQEQKKALVQYGLFLDAAGRPLMDVCSSKKKNELKEIQKPIEKDFEASRFITCTFAGLKSWENKIAIDHDPDGAIYIKSIKTMPKKLKECCLNPKGWKILGQDTSFNLDELDETISIDGKEVPADFLIFYKDCCSTDLKKAKASDKQERLVAFFSTQYKKYQQTIRDQKIAQAIQLLRKSGSLEKKDTRNPAYYIECIDHLDKGKMYSIDAKKIQEEQTLDGFYAISTDLEEKDIERILKQNKRRLEMAESFESIQSELKFAPSNISRQEVMDVHLLICFISLLVSRILELYLNDGYTRAEIAQTLKGQNITHVRGNDYVPSFVRTDLTDDLAKIFGFEFATELISEKNLKKYLRRAKSRKITQTK